MKKIQFWSLLIGLLLGSFAFVACGDDDDNSSESGGKGGTSSGTIAVKDLYGSWYLIDENSDSKLCLEMVMFAEGTGALSEMKAKASKNWEVETEGPKQFTYTFDGKRMKLIEMGFEADIVLTNGKYMITRYDNDNGKAMDTVELFKINSAEEFVTVFTQLLLPKLK